MGKEKKEKEKEKEKKKEWNKVRPFGSTFIINGNE